MANALAAVKSKRQREEAAIVEEHLRKNNGHLRPTARSMDVSLGLLRRALERHPQLATLAERLREKNGHPDWGGAR